MLSDDLRIKAHKMLVSVYMMAKLEGKDMSKHEALFNNSVEFLKSHNIRVGPQDLQKILDEPMKMLSRHTDDSSYRYGGYKWII